MAATGTPSGTVAPSEAVAPSGIAAPSGTGAQLETVAPSEAVAPAGAHDPDDGDDEERPIDFEVAGDLSTAQRNVLAIVGRCFVAALDRGEESAGALWVEVTLDDAGRSTSVKLADGFSPRMKACVPPRISHLAFPAASSDGSIRSASRVLRFPINELRAETTEE